MPPSPNKILNNIELTAKLEALEAKKPKLKDLPLNDLRKALTGTEPQDPVDMILPHSITTDLVDQSLWQTPTLLNGWQNYEANGTYAPAGYKKGIDGLVVTKGLVKHPGATGSSTVFTLPAGYRPKKNLIWAQWGQYEPATLVSFRVDVTSDGFLIVSAPAVGVDYFSINLAFYAEQ